MSEPKKISIDDQKKAVVALLEICNLIVELIKERGIIGYPAGHLYAQLMHKMTLENFQFMMEMVKQSGKVVEKFHCYFYVEPIIRKDELPIQKFEFPDNDDQFAKMKKGFKKVKPLTKGTKCK